MVKQMDRNREQKSKATESLPHAEHWASFVLWRWNGEAEVRFVQILRSHFVIPDQSSGK